MQPPINETDKPKYLVRPFVCYISQFSYDAMKQFIPEEEQCECYLEKPIPIKELVSLLMLLNFK